VGVIVDNLLHDRQTSLLLIIDIQERLAPVVHQMPQVITNTVALIEAASELKVPILATEQYRQGLGGTVAPIAAFVSKCGIPLLAKRCFNAIGEPAIREAVERSGKRDIIICGVEAHVCVLQTAMGLIGLGLRPVIARDGVSSRKPDDRDAAIDRLRAAGAVIVTTEMVIFEWLERSDSAEFRRLLPVVRALSKPIRDA
jgi:nicotinamidase-related amidase